MRKHCCRHCCERVDRLLRQGRTPLVLAVDYTGNPPISSATGTFGYSFTIGNSALTIDALALFAAAFPDPQTVRLWKDGTSTNVVSATILPTDPTTTTGHYYRYHAITPVTLQANTTYDIAYDDPGGGHDFAYHQAHGRQQ